MDRLDALYGFRFQEDFPTHEHVCAVPYSKFFTAIDHCDGVLPDGFQAPLASFDG